MTEVLEELKAGDVVQERLTRRLRIAIEPEFDQTAICLEDLQGNRVLLTPQNRANFSNPLTPAEVFRIFKVRLSGVLSKL